MEKINQANLKRLLLIALPFTLVIIAVLLFRSSLVTSFSPSRPNALEIYAAYDTKIGEKQDIYYEEAIVRETVALMKKKEEYKNLKVEIKNVPFTAVIPNVERSNLAIGCGGFSNREIQTNSSILLSEPYYEKVKNVFLIDWQKHVNREATPEKTARIIGVQRGSEAARIIEAALSIKKDQEASANKLPILMKLEYFSDLSSNGGLLQAFLEGEIDEIAVDSLTASAIVQKSQEINGAAKKFRLVTFRSRQLEDNFTSLHFILPKKWQEFVQDFNEALLTTIAERFINVPTKVEELLGNS